MAKKTTDVAKKDPAPEYTVQELKAAAHLFDGASPDIVAAALDGSGFEKLTKSAAEKIIKDFKEKEV